MAKAKAKATTKTTPAKPGRRPGGRFAECWGLQNLQPLWAGDNVKKGSSYAGA